MKSKLYYVRCDCCGHEMVPGEYRGDKYFYCPNCKHTTDRDLPLELTDDNE